MMRLLLSGNRSLQRTSEWEEPSLEESKGKMNGRSNGKMHGKSNVNSRNKPNGKSAAPQQKHDAVNEPLSSTYLQLRSSHKRRTSINIQETLPAMGEPLASNVRTMNGHEGAETNPKATTTLERSTFKVDKRSKKTCSALFYTPSPNDTPADTTWTDFVHTMLSIGFVVEKIFGLKLH